MRAASLSTIFSTPLERHQGRAGGRRIFDLQRLDDAQREPAQDPVFSAVARPTYQKALIIIEWLCLRNRSVLATQRDPGRMGRPAETIGGAIVLHEAQPVTGEVQEKLLHAGKEAWEGASHSNLALYGMPRP
jgi:hypothetical protein